MLQGLSCVQQFAMWLSYLLAMQVPGRLHSKQILSHDTKNSHHSPTTICLFALCEPTSTQSAEPGYEPRLAAIEGCEGSQHGKQVCGNSPGQPVVVDGQVERVEASVAGKIDAFKVRWPLYTRKPYGLTSALNS